MAGYKPCAFTSLLTLCMHTDESSRCCTPPPTSSPAPTEVQGTPSWPSSRPKASGAFRLEAAVFRSSSSPFVGCGAIRCRGGRNDGPVRIGGSSQCAYFTQQPRLALNRTQSGPESKARHTKKIARDSKDARGWDAGTDGPGDARPGCALSGSVRQRNSGG